MHKQVFQTQFQTKPDQVLKEEPESGPQKLVSKPGARAARRFRARRFPLVGLETVQPHLEPLAPLALFGLLISAIQTFMALSHIRWYAVPCWGFWIYEESELDHL